MISFFPQLHRDLNRYRTAFKELEAENTALTKKNKELADKSKESLIKKMKMLELERDYAAAMEFINRIPTEVFNEYTDRSREKFNRNGGHEI